MTMYNQQLLEESVLTYHYYSMQHENESAVTAAADLVCNELERQQSIQGSDVKNVLIEMLYNWKDFRYIYGK